MYAIFTWCSIQKPFIPFDLGVRIDLMPQNGGISYGTKLSQILFRIANPRNLAK
jgi:hypothetical protein